MVLLALLAALLLNHYRPCLPAWLPLFSRPLHWIAQQINAGKHEHGRLAWWLVQIPALCAVSLLWLVLQHIHPVLGFALNVAFLYPALSFQRHPVLLSTRHIVCPHSAHDDIPAPGDKTSDQIIAGLLDCSVHELFGVILYFLLFSPVGPFGIILYQLTQSMAKNWQTDAHGDFAHYAQQMRNRLDWLPIHATALNFAIAGNFEDALFYWRNNPARNKQAIVLASGAAALGIVLTIDGQNFGGGEKATADDIPATVNLIWRSLAIWLLLLLMMSLARLTA